MYRNSHSSCFLLIMFFFAAVCFGQTPTQDHSAPVEWKAHHVPSQKISLNLPKVPVIRNVSNACSQTEARAYHAYARGVVYDFEWHARSMTPIPNYCSNKNKFSRATFSARTDELKKQTFGFQRSEATVMGKIAEVFRSTSPESTVRTRWLIWDEDRWLELGMTYRKGTVVDENAFLNGLKPSVSNHLFKEVGAERTLGDSDVGPEGGYSGTDSVGMAVLSKPRPAYTDAARQANIQGTVVIRLTFLQNGGIGSVSVVKGLPLGLTEEAIKAAQKIAFLPQMVDGKPVSATKQVEYAFSIY